MPATRPSLVPESGSLRIGPPPPPAPSVLENIPGAPPQPPPATDKPYLARLVLLVPAEVISLYVAMKQAAEKFLPAFGLVCLLLVILVRAKATWADGRPEWISVGISAISFSLWIYSVGGALPYLPAPADPGIISVAIAVWTFAVPYFYQGTKPATP
ncbi:MAG: hypothetical protein QM755_02470 [Luteolibacter sp.]